MTRPVGREDIAQDTWVVQWYNLLQGNWDLTLGEDRVDKTCAYQLGLYLVGASWTADVSAIDFSAVIPIHTSWRSGSWPPVAYFPLK